MTSPYSVSSDSRMASRISGRRMSPGASSMTSWFDPEIAGHAAGVGYVVAAGSPDGERHAIGVHVTHVQEGQRAVQTAGEDNADGQISIKPHPDTVLERGPHQPWPPHRRR